MIRFEHMIFQSVFDPTDQHDNTTFPVRNRQRKPAYTPDATVYMSGGVSVNVHPLLKHTTCHAVAFHSLTFYQCWWNTGSMCK